MNFRRGQSRDEPEINLIPMIDVLLVILIFLMVTTSYSNFAHLQINLPQAAGDEGVSAAGKPINVAVDASEHYAVNSVRTAFKNPADFSEVLRKAAAGQDDPTIIINADGKATHQSVINIMEAARVAGFGRITFTTQNQNK
ncbi:ExbD/TolR family protein [Sideroxydans lithotrophicus]|uniref:Biopolymer transport protein ExbD/TolR n=1 Tax=Sideroxydans lithotrophicus (strain ES-1) TaxID=580332 RepID=D5CRL6_SIDLE|nr:biopolymer transporter ExbD [Sideroxydans lithotrophicus]ADE11602.1 Biopolymer transport protein ExbD/TolR [Sideroxydans lithotrophicus ES-1]